MSDPLDEAVAVPFGLRGHPRTVPKRRVSVAGVGGGVGTSTVAVALDATDRGVFRGRPADVLVCKATGDSLIRVGRLAQLVTAATGRKPVIAVTAADASGPSRPVTARLRLLEPHAAAVVVLPYVRRWRDLANPINEVRALATTPPGEVPRPLRRYAASLRDLRRALTGRPPASARRAPGRAPTASSTLGRTP